MILLTHIHNSTNATTVDLTDKIHIDIRQETTTWSRAITTANSAYTSKYTMLYALSVYEVSYDSVCIGDYLKGL